MKQLTPLKQLCASFAHCKRQSVPIQKATPPVYNRAFARGICGVSGRSDIPFNQHRKVFIKNVLT